MSAEFGLMQSDEGNSITEANQKRSPLLMLPAELRNTIYEFVFKGSAVCVVPERRRRLPSRNVHGAKYRGAFSLLYTCRQIHQEASALPRALVTYDFASLVYVDSATKLLGAGRSRDVRVIKISAREANKITEWVVVSGATNSNGDGHHYAMGLFPSLLVVKISNRRCQLRFDMPTIKDALRHCFDREVLEIGTC